MITNGEDGHGSTYLTLSGGEWVQRTLKASGFGGSSM